MPSLTLHDLESRYLNKNIGAICPHHYVGQNTCAHFVGHAMNLQLGLLCNLSYRKRVGRVSIRVDEIYNEIDRTGLWVDRPATAPGENLLIFVTSASNFYGSGAMRDHAQKHVGKYTGGRVVNYSNSHHKVVSDSVERFFDKCDAMYSADDITLYYGLVPCSQESA